MRIGIDIRELEIGTMTGIGRFLSNFLQYVADNDRSNDYILFGNQDTVCGIAAPNIKIKIIPERIGLFWDQFILPWQVNKERLDLFYSPYYKCPLLARCRLIVTIHDIFPLLPEAGLGLKRRILKFYYWLMGQRADLVITVSEHSKQDLRQLLKIPDNKIKVVYDSIGEKFTLLPEEQAQGTLSKQYLLRNEFILYVGNLKPHKNVSRLIQAYGLLSSSLRERYQLVICGKKDSSYPTLSAMVRDKGLSERVLFVDFAEDNVLLSLYNLASVFVFPSLNEGFGLPPLEAMACGSAVVSSNIPALKEVLAEAAIYVDPVRAEEIAEGITRVLTDNSLRDELVRKGLQRVKSFTVATEANKILEAFNTMPMQKINKILVVEVAGIGDVVMSVPALRALRARYPKGYIAALVSPRTFSLIERCPYINEAFVFSARNVISCLSTIVRLRVKKFDLAINLYQIASFWGNLRMKMLFQAIGSKLSAGRSREDRGRFFDLKFSEDSFGGNPHEVEAKLRVAGLVQAQPENKELELWPNSEDENYVGGLLREFQVKTGETLVGINPNALQRCKLWTDSSFAQLADALIEKEKLKVIFLGSTSDQPRVCRIVKLMKANPINLVGRLNLNQYAALAKRLQVFITLDSGPMHIATVFAVPTIALFGPSGSPGRFGPYLNQRAITLQNRQGIKVAEVLTAYKRLREQK
ncbi:MAG: glycosyltransferase [Candidatus Omnitrophica bacterium]|nr:glycosyltransferase [Candidatus Omnitrophota bacterium]